MFINFIRKNTKLDCYVTKILAYNMIYIQYRCSQSPVVYFWSNMRRLPLTCRIYFNRTMCTYTSTPTDVLQNHIGNCLGFTTIPNNYHRDADKFNTNDNRYIILLTFKF